MLYGGQEADRYADTSSSELVQQLRNVCTTSIHHVRNMLNTCEVKDSFVNIVCLFYKICVFKRVYIHRARTRY